MSESKGVRHEINNALAGILGHTQLLRLRGEMDEKSRERVARIEELANRISEIAEKLKD